ncbi:hypothetical protein DH2020_011176 [Rehmannia glutinosa]|uniref:BZIP domain-containing protein n=1 Tax=Rehmannia glutinosa TaxID=99300 RepID=A0ABR0XDA9_REHGL
MASWSPPNPDHPRQPSPSRLNLHSDQSRGFGSMNFEDILRNICSDSESGGGGGGEVGDGDRDKTVEEVWSEIVNDSAGGGGSGEPRMTLEDFLAKAGAVNEEDVRVSVSVTMPPPPMGGFVGMETAMMSPVTGVPAVQFAPAVCAHDGMTTGGFGVDFANGMVAVSGGASGRGKRKAVAEQVPLDKSTQQRQKRMIKNRESAARSRERKQAYTVELETLVTQLEEENARLLREEKGHKDEDSEPVNDILTQRTG